ncbi:acyltransferase family protein [Janibacter sp. G56]|uniref:acyltransferase family protein n=1 Tax=Janibacter sp. G56 TaxID=3418717 RepID=UPI003CFC9D12
MTIDPQRHRWMDVLRGAAVLLVIAWHAATIPDAYGFVVPEAVHRVNRAGAPYRQPLLLFLSGMLLGRSLDKQWRSYAAGKARAILWPLFVWTLITAAVADVSALAQPVTWLAGYRHLWFLNVLLACYAVGLLGKHMRAPWWLVAASLWSVWLVFSPQLPGVTNFLWFGGFFFAGSAAASLVPRFQGGGGAGPRAGGRCGSWRGWCRDGIGRVRMATSLVDHLPLWRGRPRVGSASHSVVPRHDDVRSSGPSIHRLLRCSRPGDHRCLSRAERVVPQRLGGLCHLGLGGRVRPVGPHTRPARRQVVCTARPITRRVTCQRARVRARRTHQPPKNLEPAACAEHGVKGRASQRGIGIRGLAPAVRGKAPRRQPR